MKKYLIIILWLLIISTVYSQSKADLQLLLDTENPTTNLVDSLVSLSKAYYKIDRDSSLLFSAKALEWSKSLTYTKGLAWSNYWQTSVNYKKGNYEKTIVLAHKTINYGKQIKDSIVLAKAYSKAGLSYFNLNQFDSALYFQKLCLEQYKLTNNKKSTAIVHNNIGSVLINLGNYKKAIYHFQKSMELFDEINYKMGTASCMLNIGQIYDLMGDSKDTVQNNKALDYYQQALSIYKKKGNDFKIAQSYNKIGIEFDQKASLYKLLSQIKDTINGQSTILKADEYYKMAIVNLSKSLDIYNKIDYKLGIAQVTNNIGTIYMNQSNYIIALGYLNQSLDANKKLNNVKELAVNHLSIAQCYRLMHKAKLALQYLNKGFDYVKEVNIPIQYQNYYEEYALTYKSLKRFYEAYIYHVKFTDVKDSLLNADNLTTINEVQAVYENKIKDKQLELSRAKLEAEQAITQKKQFQIYGFSILVFILLGLAGFIFRSFKLKKRANIILADKNDKITFQQKEITDSITYAGRIQNAVLPQYNMTKELFKEAFVLLKPQHIVSGDFYWFKEIKDKNIVIAAAADCTGHGVPGAFMSMLGMSFLNEIVEKRHVITSGFILDELKASVISALKQTGKEGEQKDGMDISLIVWYKNKHRIEFSGANNPLYLIRNNELIEYKGNKMPIGIHVKNDLFTTNSIEIINGDCIYLFSDGFADQFGGPKGKKFKYKPFKEFLLEISSEPMVKQKYLLNNKIEEWMAYIDPEINQNYKQIDDILVLGIKF